MPGRDATGPLGGGPGTGRGFGGCISGSKARCFDRGRGFGRGLGRRFGFADSEADVVRENELSRRMSILEEKIDRLIDEKSGS